MKKIFIISLFFISLLCKTPSAIAMNERSETPSKFSLFLHPYDKRVFFPSNDMVADFNTMGIPCTIQDPVIRVIICPATDNPYRAYSQNLDKIPHDGNFFAIQYQCSKTNKLIHDCDSVKKPQQAFYESSFLLHANQKPDEIKIYNNAPNFIPIFYLMSPRTESLLSLNINNEQKELLCTNDPQLKIPFRTAFCNRLSVFFKTPVPEGVTVDEKHIALGLLAADNSGSTSYVHGPDIQKIIFNILTQQDKTRIILLFCMVQNFCNLE